VDDTLNALSESS